MSDAEYELRVTARCLTEDFGRPANSSLSQISSDSDEGRSGLIRAFGRERSQSPVGRADDRMSGLAGGRVPIYIMRFGSRARGLTWHDEAGGIVWLIAAHFTHRSGEVLPATLFGDDPAGLSGDRTAALHGDAAARC